MRSPRSAAARAAIVLGLGAASSTVLGIADTSPWRFIALDGTGTLILLALAALAVVAGVLALPGLIALAGAAFVAMAVVQLIQLGWADTNLMGGNGSTMALLLGFGVGLLALAPAPPAPRQPERQPADES
ncbi:hypothetical protein ACFPA8_11090 [Streptomyces ovatisporus]|uniref:Integral membrane protein n=1 Tax=Streptomyces ovatisporus TaxID=1128682 RepID=A0ABV9A450_9ACTN